MFKNTIFLSFYLGNNQLVSNSETLVRQLDDVARNKLYRCMPYFKILLLK